ncbi:MAG: hypothetical protein EBR07_06410, partial [Planctomycetes bacterium]|nr:hypothetical protein [Planctomycetota bacterium]
MLNDFLLARIRLTRMAAERGPILSGACGQMSGFRTLVVRVPSVFEPPQWAVDVSTHFERPP